MKIKNKYLNMKFSCAAKTNRLFLFVLASALSFHLTGQDLEKLTLSDLFSDHMILQRQQPITFFGKAQPGEKICVEFMDEEEVTKANEEGDWEVVYGSKNASGPYELYVYGQRDSLQLTDLFIGDVWIAAGQSNMEWELKNTPFVEKDTTFLKQNGVRLQKIRPLMDYLPKREAEAYPWVSLRSVEIGDFTAVGYHFAKLVNKKTDIPIGIISANLGATSIETWMSNDALRQFGQFRKDVNHTKSFDELNTDFEGDDNWDKTLYYSGPGFVEQWYDRSNIEDDSWKEMDTVAGKNWEKIDDLKDFYGAVWFKTEFYLPPDFDDDTFNLQLLQIADYDITWVNGVKVGETFGENNHRNYKVPRSILKEGKNLLVVRVFRKGNIGGFKTSAFWANDILTGKWEYRKGLEIDSDSFVGPNLPNATPFSSPGVLYNGVIAPLTKLNVKGVIWYQGEANESRAVEYKSLFPALIKDWRNQFGQGNLPFLFVQLPRYREESEVPKGSKWAEMREAQSMGLNEPNTGMIVTFDTGDARDIHPMNKEIVGKRLARLALTKYYGKQYHISGPQFYKMENSGSGVRIILKNIDSGIRVKNKYGYIRGFQIAGEDKKFHWAKAELKGKDIFIYSSHVKRPKAVRYGWSDNPGELDVFNVEGIPLAPFRTDNWKLNTSGEKYEEPGF